MFEELLKVTHGSAAFQLLLAGVRLGIFSKIDEAGEIRLSALSTNLPSTEPRSVLLIKGLAALHLLKTTDEDDCMISNIDAVSKLFKDGDWSVFEKLVEFQAQIVNPGQMNFVESLLHDTNSGVSAFPGSGPTLYDRLNTDPALTDVFFGYMQSYTTYASKYFLEEVSFADSKYLIDVGGGGGALATAIIERYPHIRIDLLDTDFPDGTYKSHVESVAAATHENLNHIQTDILKDTFPTGATDVVFAHQLVIWSPDQNHQLLEKAFNALSPGGRVIIFSSVTNEDLESPLMAVLDTVYFQSVASGHGQIYPFSFYDKTLRDIGFTDVETITLKTWTPHGVVIAKRPA